MKSQDLVHAKDHSHSKIRSLHAIIVVCRRLNSQCICRSFVLKKKKKMEIITVKLISVVKSSNVL